MSNARIYHLFDNGPAPVAPALEVDGSIELTGQAPNDPGEDGKSIPTALKAQMCIGVTGLARGCRVV